MKAPFRSYKPFPYTIACGWRENTWRIGQANEGAAGGGAADFTIAVSKDDLRVIAEHCYEGEDPPESPGYIRDRTPLKKGQISTAALRFVKTRRYPFTRTTPFSSVPSLRNPAG
jgi:hypothetical protein